MTSEQTPPGDPQDAGAAPAYALAEGVVRQTVGGEMVLLDTGRRHYFGLDEVGADIVTRLVTYPEPEALAALARDYDVDAAQLDRDVRALLAQLRAAGLLRVVTDEG